MIRFSFFASRLSFFFSWVFKSNKVSLNAKNVFHFLSYLKCFKVVDLYQEMTTALTPPGSFTKNVYLTFSLSSSLNQSKSWKKTLKSNLSNEKRVPFRELFLVFGCWFLVAGLILLLIIASYSQSFSSC